MTQVLFPFELGAKWIERLYTRLRSIQKSRSRELDDISKVIRGNPLELARCYIEPKCQEINPADNPDPDYLVSKQPVMTKINEFFKYSLPPDLPGRNQMIVLADAGMGKSALLAMLKLIHLTSFWPQANECSLKKLGETTLAEITQIENKLETTLLLDSLDEDPRAYGRAEDRLLEILRAAQGFHRVILTCRTQFFPQAPSEGRIEGAGRIVIGGFDCPAKYLSIFEDSQVEAYLRKRFPNRFWFFPQKRRRTQARDVISRMGTLKCRPMLLAYIRELMVEEPRGASKEVHQPAKQTYESEYKVYEAMIWNWLRRQESKTGTSANELIKACRLLATEDLVWKPEKEIDENALKLLVAQMPDIESIQFIDVSGKSLLNRKSNGAYRFAHANFLEFLVAQRILTDPSWNPPRKVPRSDLLLDFLFQGKADLDGRLFRLDVLDLRGIDLKDRDLSNADLSQTSLTEANLSGAKLTGANLEHADLSGAKLIGASLEQADLSNANLMHADVTNANLRSADLSGADLTDVNVFGADFTSAKLEYGNSDMRLQDFETISLTPNGSEAMRRTQYEWSYAEELAVGALLEMVKIPAGRFMMGGPDDEAFSNDSEWPRHQVTVSSFYIGKHTITQSQWRTVAGWPPVARELTPEPAHFKGDDRPVEQVSWEDAVEFCARLTKKTGLAYRLSTEAEWEYACRAGTETPFAFGETITPEQVNYHGAYPYGKAPKGGYRGETVAVGSLGVANQFGLYDMHGNVWEWCEDVWHENYNGAPNNGSAWTAGGDENLRVVRGGSWGYDGLYCRSACRVWNTPALNYSIGFRVVVGARTQ